MRRLFLDKKTGFRVTDIYKPIVIRDDRGLLFYTTEALVPKVKEFNLPPGEYMIDSGSFTPTRIPRYYPLIPMPLQQRFFRPDPDTFDIKFGHNPNKCSVIWDKKTILFDSSFRDRPRPEVDFIMGHEMAHRYYGTEKFCDMYSANCMLKMGYNPSQIGYASIDSLSDRAEIRKEFLVNRL